MHRHASVAPDLLACQHSTVIITRDNLQDGLVGNRTVSKGDVWGMVTAATRAFPIQLSPSVEKAQEVLAAGTADGDLLHTWMIQVSQLSSTLPRSRCDTAVAAQHQAQASYIDYS
jgi:hypothetical protein